MRVLVGVACALAVSMAGLVHAEALNLKQVSVEAKWLAHVGADGMRASTVWDKRYSRHEERCRAMAGSFDRLRSVSQTFDAIEDLKTITLYGSQFKADSGVAIVRQDPPTANAFDFSP